MNDYWLIYQFGSFVDMTWMVDISSYPWYIIVYPTIRYENSQPIWIWYLYLEPYYIFVCNVCMYVYVYLCVYVYVCVDLNPFGRFQVKSFSLIALEQIILLKLIYFLFSGSWKNSIRSTLTKWIFNLNVLAWILNGKNQTLNPFEKTLACVYVCVHCKRGNAGTMLPTS